MSAQSAPSMRGLVSLDGNTDIITTQLRLLPTSPKVLILPPLSTAIRQPEDDVPFDARSFIRHVVELLSARLDLARSFLQSSSGTQPRLVFMNGGSASALTTCITAIREKVTNGSTQDAEEVFNTIAKGGVVGLLHEGETMGIHAGQDAPISQSAKGGALSNRGSTRSPSTASNIARSVTNAVDFIDRLIDSLQKPLPKVPAENENVNVTNSSTGTSTTPVPPDVPRLKSRFWTDQKVIPKTEFDTIEATRGRKAGRMGKRRNHDNPSDVYGASRESSTYSDAVMFQEQAASVGGDSGPPSERPSSAPVSHKLLKWNEHPSSDVDGRLTRDVVKRAKSFDYPYARDPHAASLDIGPRKLKLGEFSPFTISPLLRSEASSSLESDTSDLSEASDDHYSLPGTNYTKTPETIRRSSPPLKTVPADNLRVSVDRSTHTRDSKSPEKGFEAKSDAAEVKERTPFEPIFAMVEDLIIYFKDGSDNEVLESVIQSYRDGIYPVMDTVAPQVPMTPTSPVSPFSSDGASLSGASHTSADTDQDWPRDTPEPDNEKATVRPLSVPSDASPVSPPDSPSTYGSDDGSNTPPNGPRSRKSFWPKNERTGSTFHGILKPRLQIPVVNTAAPPPRELIRDAVARIYELSDISITNPVTLQDSFREVLEIYYPPESTHYKQHIFALENDRFWKPVFRVDARQGGHNRTVDQIIAIGYEDGVEKGLYKDLVEQFDKLETTATGTRANKLDIRFLVIYAMQTFTSQPLSLQAGENPFSQPSLLATLLIPHLETFLSSSFTTRLLILHYPVSHLSTVLALRDLLGPNLLKVAGIIDSTAISPPKPSKERPISIASVDEWVSITTSQCPSPTPESRIARSRRTTQVNMVSQPSFSKADFVLLSPATEDEVSSFVTSIWGALRFSSSLPPAPVDDIDCPSCAFQPITSSSTPTSHNAPLTPPPDRQPLIARLQKRLSPTRAPKRVSFVESTTSTDVSIEITRRRERQSEKDWEKAETERRDRLSEKAWESFVTSNDSDESLIELERIFMPHLHLMPRAARRMGDSGKALKWLGLT